MKLKLAAVGLGAAAITLATAGAAFAAPGGYGPSVPTGPANTPGGFTHVVATKSFNTDGGNLLGTVTHASLDVAVPQGAFSQPVQVEITSPNLSQVTDSLLSSVGFNGFTSTAGFGFKVLDANGKPLQGKFAKPVKVTLHGDNLGVKGQKVLRLDGPNKSSVVKSTVGNRSVSVYLDEDPNLVVVTPKSAAGNGTVPGATSQGTGKPFGAEIILGAALIAAGGGALAVARRRRVVRGLLG